MKSVKKNLMYNIIYHILILIIPLITAPYVSRIIGAEGVGIYSYKYSIVYYFMMIVLLGVNNYGNRSIAKVRDNKEDLSKTFFGIYLFQLIMGLLMIILYLTFVFVFNTSYKTIAIIQGLFLLSSMFDINWFFFGLEEFKVTIIRNMIVKLLSLILIFILVKKSSDLWIYTLIMSGTTFLSQIIIWPFLKNKIFFVKIEKKDVMKHIKPNLILFIPVIAISLYKIMDKIMLGFLTNVNEVGYYENAEKIIQIPMTIITALGTVMLPRVSNTVSNGKHDKVKEYIGKSINFIMFLSFPMTFGIIAIGNAFAPLFYGPDFVKTGPLIQLLAITIPFLSYASVIRTQYLIPYEKDMIYIKSVIFGAIINLAMNFIFIPIWQSQGACIGTICAEVVVMLYQTMSVRKELNIIKFAKSIFPFFIKSVIMFIIIHFVNLIDIKTTVIILIQIITGCMLYFILNLNYIKDNINLKKVKIVK